jgi:hypothetical protein
LSQQIPAGETEIQVGSQEGVFIGDIIQIGTETRTVVGFGSIILDRPLLFDWPASTPVVVFSFVPFVPSTVAPFIPPPSGQEDEPELKGAGVFINGGIVAALVGACVIYACNRPQQIKDSISWLKEKVTGEDDLEKDLKKDKDEEYTPKAGAAIYDLMKVLHSPKKKPRDALQLLRDGIEAVWQSDTPVTPTTRMIKKMEEASPPAPSAEPDLMVVDFSSRPSDGGMLPNAVPTTPIELQGPSPMSPLRRALHAFGVAPALAPFEEPEHPPTETLANPTAPRLDRVYPSDAALTLPELKKSVDTIYKMDNPDWAGYEIRASTKSSSTALSLTQGWQPESEPTDHLDSSLKRQSSSFLKIGPLNFAKFDATETLHLGDESSKQSRCSSQRTLVDAWSEKGSIPGSIQEIPPGGPGMAQEELDELAGMTSVGHMREPYWKESSPNTRNKYMRQRTALDIDVSSDRSDDESACLGSQSPPYGVQWDTDSVQSSTKDLASRSSSLRASPKDISRVSPSNAKRKKKLLIELPDKAVVRQNSGSSSPNHKVTMSIKSQKSWSDPRENYWVDEDLATSPARRGLSASPVNTSGPSTFEESNSINLPNVVSKADEHSSEESEDDKLPLVQTWNPEKAPVSHRLSAGSWSVVRHKFWGEEPSTPHDNEKAVATDRSNNDPEPVWCVKRSIEEPEPIWSTSNSGGGMKIRAMSPKGWSIGNGLSPKSIREFSLFGRAEPNIVDLTSDTVPFGGHGADDDDDAAKLVSVPDLSLQDNGQDSQESFEDNMDFWLHCKNTGV